MLTRIEPPTPPIVMPPTTLLKATSGTNPAAPEESFANARRVLLLGATGTAGRATAHALLRAGHDVVCVVRDGAPDRTLDDIRHTAGLPDGVELRAGNVTDENALQHDVFRGEHFDAVVSCLASRTGVATDAWAIDHRAHSRVLAAARQAGVDHMVLLSAICVQRPLLAFQHAKLAFERDLIDSGLTYSIVRPTAFFKSLSGQVERVRGGKPFLVFGDGTLTACKPIGDADLGDFIAGCLIDPARRNRILPIGGPGGAITPRDQGDRLFEMTGRKPRFQKVPLVMFDGIRSVLGQLGRFHAGCAAKAELARIGRYYATESMLVLDPDTGRYDAAATPSTGTETLFDFYAKLLDGSASVARGEHAVFREGSTKRDQGAINGTDGK